MCSFPACKSPIILNGSIIGDICHIKAQREIGERFDACQSDFERHAYENLILLCKNHHKLVDDQPLVFTVDVLQQLKVDHLVRVEDLSVTAINASDLERLIGHSIVSMNQNGGITAHTVNAKTINLSSAPDERVARKIATLGDIWVAINSIDNEMGELSYLHLILTPTEIAELVEGRSFHKTFSQIIEKFSDERIFQSVLANPNVTTAYKQELFVEPEIFKLFCGIVQLFGRLAFLLAYSKKIGKYRDWRTDQNTWELFGDIYLETVKQKAISAAIGGPNILYSDLKNRYLEAARK